MDWWKNGDKGEGLRKKRIENEGDDNKEVEL